MDKGGSWSWHKTAFIQFIQFFDQGVIAVYKMGIVWLLKAFKTAHGIIDRTYHDKWSTSQLHDNMIENAYCKMLYIYIP